MVEFSGVDLGPTGGPGLIFSGVKTGRIQWVAGKMGSGGAAEIRDRCWESVAHTILAFLSDWERRGKFISQMRSMVLEYLIIFKYI